MPDGKSMASVSGSTPYLLDVPAHQAVHRDRLLPPTVRTSLLGFTRQVGRCAQETLSKVSSIQAHTA